jgi:hypothetical protein
MRDDTTYYTAAAFGSRLLLKRLARNVDRPLLVAWLGSAAAAALAVLPVAFGSRTYDPGVAVLTATLIAIIWYTYFTHGLVRSAREQSDLIQEQLRSLRRENQQASYRLIGSALSLREGVTVLRDGLTQAKQGAKASPYPKDSENFRRNVRRQIRQRVGPAGTKLERAIGNAADDDLRVVAQRLLGAARTVNDVPSIDEAISRANDLLAQIDGRTEREGNANLILPMFGAGEEAQ